MAFKIDNLTPFANNGKRGRVPVLYIYYNIKIFLWQGKLISIAFIASLDRLF